MKVYSLSYVDLSEVEYDSVLGLYKNKAVAVQEAKNLAQSYANDMDASVVDNSSNAIAIFSAVVNDCVVASYEVVEVEVDEYAILEDRETDCTIYMAE